jgi:hypothetical protein
MESKPWFAVLLEMLREGQGGSEDEVLKRGREERGQGREEKRP